MLRFRLLIYFLSYTWSLKCGQLQDWKTWVGVYVKCYCFSIFVVVGSVYYKYQYRITYTLCCGLNRLQVYVTGIKEKQIFKRIQVATPHFWERFLQIADPCLFLWKLPRCEPKCPQQRSDIQPQALRICKKRTQKVLMFATLILLNIGFSFISVTYTWSLFKSLQNMCVLLYWR